MIDYKALRPGNWIHPTGRSKYVVVTGLLLGMMEKNEDLCKEFEGIELTGELLEAAEFDSTTKGHYRHPKLGQIFLRQPSHNKGWWYVKALSVQLTSIKTLDQLQNFFFVITGEELPLPESAKIIPQVIKP